MIAKTHAEIPIELVDEPEAPTRLRIDADKFDQLCDSMRHKGQLQNGGVVRHGARYIVIYGHRRLLALRAIGALVYLAYVYESAVDAMLDAQLDENVIRHDLNPVEEAYWFAQLLDALGGDTNVLAERLHKGRDYVEGRLNLLRGDEQVLERLGRGAITLGVARALNKCPNVEHRRMLLDVCIHREATAHTAERWVADYIAAGGVSSPPTDAPDGNGAAAAAPIQSYEPVCRFCGESDEIWTMETQHIHRRCKLIQDRLTAAPAPALEPVHE